MIMHDTYVTVVGNLVTKPERRRVESNGSTVVNFRIGSTSRRFDKATGGWVDGNTFFVKVSCWRSLAENAYQSLFKGDPVLVRGRIFTREYLTEDGAKRVSYEMEASSIGHNLARGTSTFTRTRAVPTTDAPADDELPAETVSDEVEVPDDEAPESYPYAPMPEPVGAV
jgi:single-strand DNA-binding protein